jgi:hypothetical protein
MELIGDGAAGSAGALRVTGSVSAAIQYPWAGVMFSPGSRVFAPENLSANAGFSFAIRGDGTSFNVLVFSESLGRTPAVKTFQSTDGWASHSYVWSAFRGIDGSDIMAIVISAVEGADSFWFELDNFLMTPIE